MMEQPDDESGVTPRQMFELQETLNRFAGEHKIIILPPGAKLRIAGDVKRISREIAALLNEAEEAGYGVLMDDEGVWLGFLGADSKRYAATVSADLVDGEMKWVGTDDDHRA